MSSKLLESITNIFKEAQKATSKELSEIGQIKRMNKAAKRDRTIRQSTAATIAGDMDTTQRQHIAATIHRKPGVKPSRSPASVAHGREIQQRKGMASHRESIANIVKEAISKQHSDNMQRGIDFENKLSSETAKRVSKKNYTPGKVTIRGNKKAWSDALKKTEAKGVGHVSWDREPSAEEVAGGVLSKLGKEKITQGDAVKRAAGSSNTYSDIKKGKDAEKARNMAPVTYDKHNRRDRKAGPKGHSAKNTFEPAKRSKTSDKFNFSKEKAPMSRNAINRSGVAGQSVTRDGQKIPSERWSALKGALANRKFGKAMSKIPDGN